MRCPLRHQGLRRSHIRYMHDDGVVRRPALGRIDARHSLGLQSMRAQPVDRLGRKGDELALAQALRGGGDGLRISC